MINKTKIVRTDKNKNCPYLKISKSITDLPFYEASLMFKLLSNSDEFIINKTLIEKQTDMGRRLFKKVWDNLTIKGFIIQKRNTETYNRNHKVIGWDYMIFENPKDNPEYNQNGSIQTRKQSNVEYNQNGSIQNGKIKVEYDHSEHIQNGSINNNKENNTPEEKTGGVETDNSRERTPVPSTSKENTGPKILDQKNEFEDISTSRFPSFTDYGKTDVYPDNKGQIEVIPIIDNIQDPDNSNETEYTFGGNKESNISNGVSPFSTIVELSGDTRQESKMEPSTKTSFESIKTIPTKSRIEEPKTPNQSTGNQYTGRTETTKHREPKVPVFLLQNITINGVEHNPLDETILNCGTGRSLYQQSLINTTGLELRKIVKNQKDKEERKYQKSKNNIINTGFLSGHKQELKVLDDEEFLEHIKKYQLSDYQRNQILEDGKVVMNHRNEMFWFNTSIKLINRKYGI